MITPALVAELLRRTVERSNTPLSSELTARDVFGNEPHPNIRTLSGVGFVTLFLLSLGFIVLLLCFDYTCTLVIGTLAFVEKETPTSDIDIDGPPAYDTVTGNQTAGSDEVYTAPPTGIPVTSSLRRALRHLYSIRGVWSFFRGLACAICYNIAAAIITFFFLSAFLSLTGGHLTLLAGVLGGLVSSILLTHVSAAWTHIVISAPSPKTWTRRLPGFSRSVRNLWRATLLKELCLRIAVNGPVALAYATGLVDPKILDRKPVAAISHSLGLLALVIVLQVVLVIPATMVLARTQASMLPEEDETIVAFDRSFGGKVEPAIVGGSGALGLVDAWKSVDRSSQLRVIKLFVKLVAMEIAITVAWVLAAGAVIATTRVTK